MRKLLLILLFLPVISVAEEVKCYSNFKLIYQHKVHEVEIYDDSLMSWIEDDTNHFVYSNLECVIKLKDKKR
jgi:hypothetical protein